MDIRFIRLIIGASLICLLLSTTVAANTVAILDQGFNSTLSHKGFSKFVTQHCISYADKSVEAAGPPEPGFSVVLSTFNASLCGNGAPQQFFNGGAAYHPRTFLEPISKEVLTTSSRLDHARDMSNAIWDFNRTIFHQHFQVYGMAGNGKNETVSLQDIVAATSSYKSRSGIHIAQALNFLSLNNDPNLGAVVIATVVGNRVSTPSTCGSLLGQAAVNRLRSKGIPVIAGLANNDIPAGTKTWPNCLFGVINIGRTDGFAPPFKGIGIGSNGIDFYTRSAVQSGSLTSFGNSFAAPKIAAAFALLHKSHPSATVNQKYKALQRASSSMYTYKGNTRRRIRNSQINNAIAELEIIIQEDNNTNDNPNDNIGFDPTNYGVAFGGSSSDLVEIDVDFSALSKVLDLEQSAEVPIDKNTSQSQSFTPNGKRDVVLSFTGIFDEGLNFRRKFNVKLNGAIIETLDGFSKNQEATKVIIINRNQFRRGNNKIRIQPINGASKWGVKDISLTLVPVIPLTIGTLDTNQYGYSETPTRYTGARFKFDLASREFDHLVTLTGWDIDSSDETGVFINGNSVGFLSVGPSSSYSSPDTFILPASMLSVGENIIELQQREPGGAWDGFEFEKWAVKDILVRQALIDLQLDEVEIVDGVVTKTKPFNLNVKVSNLGDITSPTSTIKVYVSPNEVIDSSDNLVSSFSIQSINVNRSITASKAVTSNKVNEGYFIGACVEVPTTESKISNNCSLGVPLRGQGAIVPILMFLLNEETIQ